MSGSDFWIRYFDSFEGTGSNQGSSSALALALLLPTFVLWVLWRSVAWLVRLFVRR
ncbi:hypothetical protein ACI3KY_14570 [Microbacterium sp. ZW T2_14]|uniref:hypothetical protein n=1 Tax=Microbacterium sp. ZW T2_14 TaxID=3378079 RepID=UPI0038521646